MALTGAGCVVSQAWISHLSIIVSTCVYTHSHQTGVGARVGGGKGGGGGTQPRLVSLRPNPCSWYIPQGKMHGICKGKQKVWLSSVVGAGFCIHLFFLFFLYNFYSGITSIQSQCTWPHGEPWFSGHAWLDNHRYFIQILNKRWK